MVVKSEICFFTSEVVSTPSMVEKNDSEHNVFGARTE